MYIMPKMKQFLTPKKMLYIFRFFICVLDSVHKFDNYIRATFVLSQFSLSSREACLINLTI